MLKQIKSLFFIESFVFMQNSHVLLQSLCDCLYFCVIVTNRVVIFVTVKELVNYCIIINYVCVTKKLSML
jgi:hypothetical protein